MKKTIVQKSAETCSTFPSADGSKNLKSGDSSGNSPICGPDAEIGINTLDILNALPFYVIIVDADHLILEANDEVYTHLGVKREDVLGQYCPLIIHGINHPFEGCPLEEAAQTNKAVERELFDAKSGRTIRSSIYPISVLSRKGKKIFLHMVTDITEHKRTEEQLRTSLEQLRVLSAHLETVKEEEKRKIAADLHDETSQLLAGLNALLEAAIGTLPNGANKTEAILRKAQTISITILDDLHKLIYNLRPSLLDRFGLRAAISALVDSHLKVSVPKVTFKSMGKLRRLAPSLEIAIYRVVQEAFNNIVKHAHAGSANVKIDFKKASIKILIEDDGVGFDPKKTTNPKAKFGGLGLLGMKERLEPINGSLTIQSSPGCSTKIIIEVPLTNEVHDG